MQIIHKEIFYSNQSESFTFLPISDVHLGNYLCDEKQLHAHLAKHAVKDNTFIFTVGDISDSIIASDAKRYLKSHVDYDGDDILNDQAVRIKKIFEPYKEKIIAWGDGNHEDNIVKRCSYNISKDVATRLEAPYTGYVYMIHLSFQHKPKGKVSLLKIFCHHGWGGGSRTAGAVLTKYASHSLGVDADICCYAHDHRCLSDYNVIIGSSGMRAIEKKRYVVVCGSYLKTFSKTSSSSYSEKGGYRATAISSPIITIWPDTGRYHQPQIEVRT